MKDQLNIESAPRLVLCAATAADLMVPHPVCIAADATLREAAAFLADQGISAAPVIDKAGRPVGVLSQSDIVGHERDIGPYAVAEPEYYKRVDLSSCQPRIIWTDVVNVDPIPVSEIMSRVVFFVAPETPAPEVIENMLARNVHRLFVIGGDGVLTGVISTIDVLRHLHLDQPPAESTVTAGETSRRFLGYQPW